MTRSQVWDVVARQALDAFITADTGNETPHAYAYMAGAISITSGSNDPNVLVYRDRVMAARNPSGGWGLGYAWDAFQNGTINPADTDYTITMSDHIGLQFLDLYVEGLVDGQILQDLVVLVMKAANPPQGAVYTTAGRCAAYSLSTNDRVTKVGGVNNVNAAAAHFLARARLYGFTAPGLDACVAEMTKHEVAHWSRQTKWWPYANTAGSRPADTDHAAAEAWNMSYLAPFLALETGRKILTDPTVTPDAIAFARAANIDASLHALADQHIPYVSNFVTTGSDNREKAQIAYWAAYNAMVMP